MQAHLDQLFAVHATLSRQDWEDVKQTEQWYLDLDPAQQDYADRKAKARIGINEIAAQTIQARQAAQAQHLRNVQQENDDREELARQLRDETERCQDLIERKIAEAQDHLDNRRYREALNAAREGQDLLTGKKGGAIQGMRRGYHGVIKAFTGKSNYTDQFVDRVME